MRRAYETPAAEKVAFRYQEQVAASSTTPAGECIAIWINEGEFSCETGNKYHQPYNNI